MSCVRSLTLAFVFLIGAVPSGMAQDIGQLLERARSGDVIAMYEVGTAYEEGLGTLQDYAEAHAWYNLAAAKGSITAKEQRDLLQSKMTPDQVASAQAKAKALFESLQSSEISSSPPQRAVQQEPRNESTSDVDLAMEIQRLLLSLGYKIGAVDGVIGPKTREALAYIEQNSRMGLRLTGDRLGNVLNGLRTISKEGNFPLPQGGAVADASLTAAADAFELFNAGKYQQAQKKLAQVSSYDGFNREQITAVSDLREKIHFKMDKLAWVLDEEAKWEVDAKAVYFRGIRTSDGDLSYKPCSSNGVSKNAIDYDLYFYLSLSSSALTACMGEYIPGDLAVRCNLESFKKGVGDCYIKYHLKLTPVSLSEGDNSLIFKSKINSGFPATEIVLNRALSR